jgi:hypothetical protein
MIQSSYNRICQSITINKVMTIVQKMCFIIYFIRHAPFVFLFLSHFLSTYSRKPQGRHQYRKERANSKCLLHIKKKGKRRKRRSIWFFFSSPTIIFFYLKDRFSLPIERHVATEKTKFSAESHFFFLFRFFIVLVMLK